MDINIRGVSHSTMLSSPNGSYISNNKYCFGKATSIGFQTIVAIEPKDLIYGVALTQAISPYTYKDGERKKSHILGVGNVVILDIDADQPDPKILEAISNIDVEFYTIPSQNHLIGNSIRYRLFIPFKGISINPDQYSILVDRLIERFNIPYVDNASKGYARFYAPTIPIAGMPFARFSEEYPTPYTVTAEDIEEHFLKRLGIGVDNGKFVLNPTYYPFNDDHSKRLVVTDDMLQAQTEDFKTATEKPIIVGDTLTEVYDVRSDDKNISAETMQFLLDKGKMAIGDVAHQLSRNTRVTVECPTSHLHSDPNDKAYAWLLKDGGIGKVRLFCESNHCKEKFGSGGRELILPNYKEFIIGGNIDTATAVDKMYERLENYILFHLGGEGHILAYTGVSFDNRFDAQAYARDVFTNDLVDMNAVKVMILHTFLKGKFSSEYVYKLTPAGTIIGDVKIPAKNQSTYDIVDAWGSYIFKHKWNEFRDFTKDKAFTQGAILRTMLHHITQDGMLITESRLIGKMDASLLIEGRRRVRMDVADKGLTCEYIDNSFDTILLEEYRRLKPIIEQIGVQAYNEIETAFVKHWELPLGKVEWDGNTATTLPQVIMYLSLLNMYSGAQASMQRHTTIGVVAPPSMGKTSLCNQFHELGLTNSPNDMKVQDIAPEGLSAIGLSKFNNKMFITADEVDAKKFKHQISEDKFRSNLTSSQLTINIKGKVDSVITAYAKVLWGTQLRTAFESLDAPYEMLNRMFIIDYSALFEERQYIHNILQKYSPYDVDAVIRFHIIKLFLGVRKNIMALDKDIIYRFFSNFIDALKKLYLGSLEVDTQINHNGEVEVVSVKEMTTDKNKQEAIILRTLEQWSKTASSHPLTAMGTPLIERSSVDNPNFRYMLQRETAMLLMQLSLKPMGKNLWIDDVIQEGTSTHEKLVAFCEFLMCIHPTRVYIPLSFNTVDTINTSVVSMIKNLAYYHRLGKLGHITAADFKRVLIKTGFKAETLSKIPEPDIILETQHGGRYCVPKLKPPRNVIRLMWIEKSKLKEFIDGD